MLTTRSTCRRLATREVSSFSLRRELLRERTTTGMWLQAMSSSSMGGCFEENALVPIPSSPRNSSRRRKADSYDWVPP